MKSLSQREDYTTLYNLYSAIVQVDFLCTCLLLSSFTIHSLHVWLRYHSEDFNNLQCFLHSQTLHNSYDNVDVDPHETRYHYQKIEKTPSRGWCFLVAEFPRCL